MPRAKGSKNVHKLTRIDENLKIAMCAHCGAVRIKKVKRVGAYGWRCKKQSNLLDKERKRIKRLTEGCPITNIFKRHKGKTCERCGFIPVDKCQLDVHHKDGNHSNNAQGNLQTLCANCHRLVTKLENQGIYKASPIF